MSARLFWVAIGLMVVSLMIAAREHATQTVAREFKADLGSSIEAVDQTFLSQAQGSRRDRELAEQLKGLWHRYDQHGSGQPVRFYYFHGDGKGLYRYGKNGYTQTHSFDYQVVDGRVQWHFRHRGERATSALTLQSEADGRLVLHFANDPREANARYYREASAVTAMGEVWRDHVNDGLAPIERGIGGRFWMDYRELAAGGYEWQMYQFNPTAIDGRGIGWFHRGTFDDWTTEALTYRVSGEMLELHFELSGQSEHTEMSLSTRDDGKRVVELAHDPRDFWLRHRYTDVGASFGMRPALRWLDPGFFAQNP